MSKLTKNACFKCHSTDTDFHTDFHQRRVDPTFPAVNRLALYFCRHGHLWVENSTVWTNNPQFSEVEDWFFKRAKEEFRRA